MPSGITPRMMSMPSYSKSEVILVRYPFSALSGVKVRPAIIVNAPHVSQDVFIVPLTSRTTSLLAGEFVLTDWAAAGLHVPTAVKRGLYTAHETLVLKRVGRLTLTDVEEVVQSLRQWLVHSPRSTWAIEDSMVRSSHETTSLYSTLDR